MAAEYGGFWLTGPTVAHPLNATPHKLTGAMRALSVVPLQAGSAAVVEVMSRNRGTASCSWTASRKR
jgi:hypothetical protein